MDYNVTLRRVRITRCCGKVINTTYSECTSIALVIQHAMCMRRIILPSLPCPSLQYFSALSHKRHDIGGGGIGHKPCGLTFSTAFVWNISHFKKNSARHYHKCTQVFLGIIRLSCQVLMKLEFSRRIFEKKTHFQISWKSVKWKPSQMTKLIAPFPNFLNAPENSALSQNNCEYWVLPSSCLSQRNNSCPIRRIFVKIYIQDFYWTRTIQFRSKCGNNKNHFTEFIHKFQQWRKPKHMFYIKCYGNYSRLTDYYKREVRVKEAKQIVELHAIWRHMHTVNEDKNRNTKSQFLRPDLRKLRN